MIKKLAEFLKIGNHRQLRNLRVKVELFMIVWVNFPTCTNTHLHFYAKVPHLHRRRCLRWCSKLIWKDSRVPRLLDEVVVGLRLVFSGSTLYFPFAEGELTFCEFVEREILSQALGVIVTGLNDHTRSASGVDDSRNSVCKTSDNVNSSITEEFVL